MGIFQENQPVESRRMQVADLAKSANVTPATVRYYTRTGLLKPERDPNNDYRCYGLSDLQRVEFVKQAQRLGLTIRDIKAVLNLVEQGQSPCDKVRELVTSKLESIRTQMAELEVLHCNIVSALEMWQEGSVEGSEQETLCPLVSQANAAERKLQ